MLAEPTGREGDGNDDQLGSMGWLPKWDEDTPEPNQWNSNGSANSNPGFHDS